ADNENLLELCLNLAFGLTADPQSAVFFSIAGGRKTMSSCLTLAAQMYGRPQDRIFHVLVSPEFESNRDFFYPPRISHAIRCIGANREPFYKETCYARVTLVPVPFVSIRESLEPELLNRPSDPATLLASLVREEKPVLTVDLPGCKLTYRNLEMDLSCAHMALYAFFAIQKKDCEKPLSCKACTECFLPLPQILEHSQDIERLYRRIAGTRPLVQMSTTGIASLDAENFNSYKSKIKRSLQKSFGQHAMQELEIASSGSRPDTCYGLPLQKERIRIVF
ncbi:MAG: CRISPR-associated ring nuclease Csm6, partial [Desulfatibacillaceae bacterium]|nr:CRISPR-associated ring nuclease Csm6 [Desulfatibacillaceae bacterium]